MDRGRAARVWPTITVPKVIRGHPALSGMTIVLLSLVAAGFWWHLAWGLAVLVILAMWLGSGCRRACERGRPCQDDCWHRSAEGETMLGQRRLQDAQSFRAHAVQLLQLGPGHARQLPQRGVASAGQRAGRGCADLRQGVEVGGHVGTLTPQHRQPPELAAAREGLALRCGSWSWRSAPPRRHRASNLAQLGALDAINRQPGLS